MWEFLDRLFNVALPRVRDFRGISADAFDGRGNYSMEPSHNAELPKSKTEEIVKSRGKD